MASTYWLKLYHEMLDDPKVMTLRPALRWRFIEALLVAGELDQGGKLPATEEYAWRVRDNAEIVETELVQLADVGLLSKHNGGWLVTKFVERQSAVSDAERMRRMRERQQKQEYYEPDTPEQRDSYDDVTKRNADTDIDKETDRESEERRNRSARARKPLSPLSDSPADQRTAAIAEVCGLDPDIDTHRAECEQATVKLSKFTADYILARYLPPEAGGDESRWNWYVDDWRRPEQPRPAQVVETISKYRVKARASPPVNGSHETAEQKANRILAKAKK